MCNFLWIQNLHLIVDQNCYVFSLVQFPGLVWLIVITTVLAQPTKSIVYSKVSLNLRGSICYLSDAVELKCQAPTISGGTVSPSTAISPGSSYTVTCSSGHTIKGSNTVTCTKNGDQATLSTLPTYEKGTMKAVSTGAYKLSYLPSIYLFSRLILFVIVAIVF